MIVYRTTNSPVLEHNGQFYSLGASDMDEIVCHPDLYDHLESITKGCTMASPPRKHDLLAPIGRQEVWAAGVTYFRSRTARMQESEEAGGSSFYDRVYSAERPELFFKAAPHKVVGPGGKIAIRSDALWSVPEPELALLINPSGQIIGYTIGNDMSCAISKVRICFTCPRPRSTTGPAPLGRAYSSGRIHFPRQPLSSCGVARRKNCIFREYHPG